MLCASVLERNLLADTAKVVEKNKICRRKDEFCRKVVTDGLLALGYDASICKSRWEKSPSYPAGIYFLSFSLTQSRTVCLFVAQLSVSVWRRVSVFSVWLVGNMQKFPGKKEQKIANLFCGWMRRKKCQEIRRILKIDDFF